MKTKLPILAALTLLLASASVSFGQWLQTASGTYDYNSGANWTSANINGVFPNSLTVTGTQAITFGANTTLTTGLDFFSGGANRMIMSGTGADRTVTLGGDVRVFLAGGNFGQGVPSQVVGLGSQTAGQLLNVDLGGVTRTFNVWANRGNGQGFELANNITNGGITMNGPGVLGVSGSTSFTGVLTVSQGQLLASGNGSFATTSISLGATQGYFNTTNGYLNLDSRANSNIGPSNTANFNRISDSGTINSSGGRLAVASQSVASGTETIGTVNLNSGFTNIAALTPGSVSATDPSMTIAITTLNRTAGATIAFGGGGRNVQTGNATYALGQVSGTGSRSVITFGSGASNNVGGIIPWGVIGNGTLNANAQSFATYGANGVAGYGYDGSGVEIVGAYASTLSGTNATNLGNVKLTATDVTNSDYTINSLTLNTAGSVGVASRTITVESGAILSTAGFSRIFSDIDVNGREAILYGNSGELSITGQIRNTGGNGVTISGFGSTGGLSNAAASVTFTGAQTNYTGPTTVNSGVLRLQAVNALPTASAVRVDPNGLVNMGGNSQAWASLSGDGKVEFNSQNSSGALTNTLTIGSGNTDTTFSGLISSTFFTGLATGGNLTKVGTGALTLSGASSTYSGTTSVANGSLVVANDTFSAAPNRTVSINTTTDLITLASHGLTNGQTVIFTSNNSNPTSTNSYFVASTPMIVTNVTGSTFQITNLVGGPVVDFLTSPGTVQVMLPGALGNNNTAIHLGTAATGASDNISLLVGGAFTMGRDVTVNNQNTSGTTTLGGNTAAASVFSGNVALSKSINLTAVTGGNTTFSGAISGSGFGVTKTGNGTVTLSNTNSYTGVTTISAGTLLLTSTGLISSSSAIDFTSSGAGTLDVSGVSGFQITANQTLRGTGKVIGSLTVASSGTLAPGNSPGTITFDNDLTLAGGSVSNFEINGLTANLYDLALGGVGSQTVNFGGTLNLVFQGGFNTLGTVKIFDIETYAGSFSAVNTSGLDTGFTASFSSLDGVVTVIPEPTTWMLLAFSLTALMVFRRRRQQFKF